jgi:putative RNA 2'-phosphotransferase
MIPPAMNTTLMRYSKFMSLVLRHRPKLIGLNLDEGGWARVDALLAGMNAKGMPVDLAVLEQVVAENDKQRFTFNADRTKIRANQGHSIAVALDLPPRTPPDCLYHGTASKNISSIRGQGLKKGKRQAVHLSADTETAVQVGGRHGEPVVLVIDAARMAADGFVFTCSENGVWLVEHVPPGYIHFP